MPASRIWSMNPQISGGAGRAPARRKARLPSKFVGLPQISGLPFKVLDPVGFLGGDTWALGAIDLGLQHPPAQRLHTHPGLGADRLAAYTDRYSPR